MLTDGALDAFTSKDYDLDQVTTRLRAFESAKRQTGQVYIDARAVFAAMDEDRRVMAIQQLVEGAGEWNNLFRRSKPVPEMTLLGWLIGVGNGHAFSRFAKCFKKPTAERVTDIGMWLADADEEARDRLRAAVKKNAVAPYRLFHSSVHRARAFEVFEIASDDPSEEILRLAADTGIGYERPLAGSAALGMRLGLNPAILSPESAAGREYGGYDVLLRVAHEVSQETFIDALLALDKQPHFAASTAMHFTHWFPWDEDRESWDGPKLVRGRRVGPLVMAWSGDFWDTYAKVPVAAPDGRGGSWPTTGRLYLKRHATADAAGRDLEKRLSKSGNPSQPGGGEVDTAARTLLTDSLDYHAAIGDLGIVREILARGGRLPELRLNELLGIHQRRGEFADVCEALRAAHD